MEHSHLIRDISLSIVGAWVFALVARFIRLPVMIAYLAAGVLLGPVGFGWIADRQFRHRPSQHRQNWLGDPR